MAGTLQSIPDVLTELVEDVELAGVSDRLATVDGDHVAGDKRGVVRDQVAG